ncbi:hypothetical protein [Pseudomonas rhizosphaerae]|jgi:hypothetical protein|uniref:hypothetical protein n=1 Tax=Pseudomonas rhizosphaerae TaxID=216142 RepID=UPI0005B9B265|nr:hypothetical protein [Pseudomonas rhizosphaerae]MEB2872339.1 hypothetical protein [Pseudomonas rhizosphaerae]
MSEPGDKASAQPLPVLGAGCASRYDPEALSEEHGTDFPGAEALWAQQLCEQQVCEQQQGEPVSDADTPAVVKPDDPAAAC